MTLLRKSATEDHRVEQGQRFPGRTVDCSRYQICTWEKNPPHAHVSWPSRELALSNERGAWVSWAYFVFISSSAGHPGSFPGLHALLAAILAAAR